jgi:hypothetical protein
MLSAAEIHFMFILGEFSNENLVGFGLQHLLFDPCMSSSLTDPLAAAEASKSFFM